MSLPSIAPYDVPAEMPENRLGWTADATRAVLLVHDMQRYFIAPYEANAEPMTTVVPNIARLRAKAIALGIPVVFSMQPGDQSPQDRRLLTDLWGPGLRAAPEHEDIIADLTPGAADVRLTKWRYSAFQRTNLRARLHEWGRDQLVVSGVYAHLGCLLTACDAFMQDVQPFFVADAVADFSLPDHEMALRYAASRCGVVLSTDGLLEQLRPGKLSVEQIRNDVVEILGVDPGEISDDDNLVDCGLDSIRILHLLEKWREAGAEPDFVELTATPAISSWQRLLTGERNSSSA